MAGQLRAWHLGPAGVYVPWEPAAHGRWESAALGLSFIREGRILRPYDPQGRPLPNYRDLARELAEQRQRLTERDRAMAEQQRQLAALEAELRRLRGDRR